MTAFGGGQGAWVVWWFQMVEVSVDGVGIGRNLTNAFWDSEVGITGASFAPFAPPLSAPPSGPFLTHPSFIYQWVSQTIPSGKDLRLTTYVTYDLRPNPPSGGWSPIGGNRPRGHISISRWIKPSDNFPHIRQPKWSPFRGGKKKIGGGDGRGSNWGHPKKTMAWQGGCLQNKTKNSN